MVKINVPLGRAWQRMCPSHLYVLPALWFQEMLWASTLAGALRGWQQQQIKAVWVVNQGEDKVRERR